MDHSEAEMTRAQQQVDRRRRAWRIVALVALAAAIGALGLVVSLVPAPGTASSPGQKPVTVIAKPTTLTVLPPVSTMATAPQLPGYRLVFDDEFTKPGIDPKRWATTLAWGNTNPGEGQYYTPDALAVKNGVLTMTMRQQPKGGRQFTSGVITSWGRFSFLYGRAEIRAKLPSGQGLWSAFWMIPHVKGGNEEIDVFEVLGANPIKTYSVLHYGTMLNRGKVAHSFAGPDFSAAYHTFAVDWQPNLIVWYVDGVETYRLTDNVPANPMYLVTNLSVGTPGTWAGPPNSSTTFPAQYQIDYVRVYQR